MSIPPDAIRHPLPASLRSSLCISRASLREPFLVVMPDTIRLSFRPLSGILCRLFSVPPSPHLCGPLSFIPPPERRHHASPFRPAAPSVHFSRVLARAFLGSSAGCHPAFSFFFSPAYYAGFSLCISRASLREPIPNSPAISDRAASFSSSVLFTGDGVCGTVIDISGRAAKPDTRADYRLRHHLYMIYHRLDIL